MASITELLDKLKNARATVELVEACGKRVCSSEEHWDCPYGNEGMTDCAVLLEAAYEDTIENLLQLAEAIPADVVSVVHGRWDDSGRYTFPCGATAVRCTECGCALTESEYHLQNWNYCPVCGAKMDGGADHAAD